VLTSAVAMPIWLTAMTTAKAQTGNPSNGCQQVRVAEPRLGRRTAHETGQGVGRQATDDQYDKRDDQVREPQQKLR
jgi:hypothetical protein